MKPDVILVAGYNSDQGEETVDRLKQPLISLGYVVTDPDYRGARSGPISGIFRTLSYQNYIVATRIAYQIKQAGRKVILVAHSNGVAVTSYIVEILEECGLLRLIERVVAIHGALTHGYRWSCRVVNIYGDDMVLTVGANTRRAVSYGRCFIKKIFKRQCTGSRWGDYGAHPDLCSGHCKNIRSDPGHSSVFKTATGIKLILIAIQITFYPAHVRTG